MPRFAPGAKSSSHTRTGRNGSLLPLRPNLPSSTGATVTLRPVVKSMTTAPNSNSSQPASLAASITRTSLTVSRSAVGTRTSGRGATVGGVPATVVCAPARRVIGPVRPAPGGVPLPVAGLSPAGLRRRRVSCLARERTPAGTGRVRTALVIGSGLVGSCCPANP